MALFKRFTVLLVLGFLLSFAAKAQGNGNGNGSNGWPNFWPQYVLSWLQQGGQIPQPLAMHILHDVRDWGQQTLGLSQGQMIQKYYQGSIKIEFLQVAPPTMTFRVSSGGDTIVVLQDDF